MIITGKGFRHVGLNREDVLAIGSNLIDQALILAEQGAFYETKNRVDDNIAPSRTFNCP